MTKKQSKGIKKGTLVRVKSGDAKPVYGIFQGVNASCIGEIKIADGSIITYPLGQITVVKDRK